MRSVVTILAGLCVAFAANASEAVIIAQDGFEGVPGEIGHAVSGPAGTFATEQLLNVRTGLRSLRAGVSTTGTKTTTVTFNPVDVSDFDDIGVSVWWRAPSTSAFEPSDNLTIRVTHDGSGASPVVMLNVSDAALDGNIAYAEATGLIPDDATMATLELLVTVSEPNNEDIFFDDVVFTGTPFVPEPSSGILALVGLTGWLGMRRRRRMTT